MTQMMTIAVVEGALLWQPSAKLSAPSANQVRIRVAAAGVNRADIIQAQGHYPPPPGASDVLGLEVSGVIEAIGDTVHRFATGDRVMALLSGGGYATHVVVDAGLVMRIPAAYSFVQAAGVMETLSTVVLNLVEEASAQSGESLLIHAGCSGVGTMALQVGAILGLRTFVTVGNANKLAIARALGAVDGVVRHDEDFSDKTKEWTDGRGMDIILDPVGGGYLGKNQRSLATDGRLVIIGIMGGRHESLDLGRLLVKRQRIIGSTLRSRPLAAKIALVTMMRERFSAHLDNGALMPRIHAVLPVDAASQAHALLASNVTIGKVVLRIDDV